MRDSNHEGQSARRHRVSRRDFMRLGTVSAAAPALLFARTRAIHPVEKRLAFYNLHTGERLSTIYWAEGRYVAGALKQINWILRDYRRDTVKPIDLRLLDMLYALDRRLETRQPFHIICGYRSPATNQYLREHTAGVAKHSMHIEGKAVDIRIPGCHLTSLQHAALALHDGGVGIYPVSDFVHVDVGRVRHWKFPPAQRRANHS